MDTKTSTSTSAASGRARPRTIVMIAGAKSHGPEGNGVHDYPWDARVAAAMLASSDVADRVRVRVVVDGWPDDEAELADADAIVLFCDGRDGEHFTEALHLVDATRAAAVERLMARGCGLAVIHFGTFACEADAERALRWCGGYFQWQGDDGARAWRSAITTLDAPVKPETPGHEALRGVTPFALREEFYHDLRFPDADPTWTPLLSVPELPAKREHGTVVAWARERTDGGRGFATTLGHFHANWRLPAYRTALLNGIAWSSGVEIPAQGVQAPFLSRDQAASILRGQDRDQHELRVLLLAGNDAHRWHNWERSTPAIRSALEADPRIRVDVITDPEELGRRRLADYAAIALNYCNWQDPRGLSDRAKSAFSGFVAVGGGLLVLHFSNGAFHRSLPDAAASDWPEYRRLVRRVWDHAELADGTSAHDAYRTFIAYPGGDHVISDGLSGFVVEDELYVKQRGNEPITAILGAHSQLTQGFEPLAWTYRYGKGRVFQTLLGHSERTYAAFGAREMLRRAAAWVSGREVFRIDPAAEPGPALSEALSAVTAGAQAAAAR